MNVVVNGLMTSYQKTGVGKALVFLPGWADDSRTAVQLAEYLKDEYEVVSIDLPGFGGSQPPPSAWGLAEYADFVERFLNKVGLKPYALIGHSYGGAVAVAAASRAPICQYLILLASAGIRNKNPVRKKLLAATAKIGRVPLLVLSADKRNAVRAKVYGSLGSDIMSAPHMEQTFRKIINQDVRDLASQINIPTLLIYGSRDKATPISDGHILNRAIKGSRLEVIGAGHFLHQESPKKVARLIRDFLE